MRSIHSYFFYFLLSLFFFAISSNDTLKAQQWPSDATNGLVYNQPTNPLEDIPLERPDIHHLVNIGYQVGYSESLKDPLWSFYVLNSYRSANGFLSRPKVSFHCDKRTLAQVETKDYVGMNYDRGHMAPSFAIGKFYGRDAQLQTFLLSNICPQKHLSNDGVWNSIERMECDDFAKRFGYIETVCGPLFAQNPPLFPSGIAIPYAHYKVIERPDGGLIAFIVPQEPTNPRPEFYLASVTEIEKLTGLTIFPHASAEEKNKKRICIW